RVRTRTSEPLGDHQIRIWPCRQTPEPSSSNARVRGPVASDEWRRLARTLVGAFAVAAVAILLLPASAGAILLHTKTGEQARADALARDLADPWVKESFALAGVAPPDLSRRAWNELSADRSIVRVFAENAATRAFHDVVPAARSTPPPYARACDERHERTAAP